MRSSSVRKTPRGMEVITPWLDWCEACQAESQHHIAEARLLAGTFKLTLAFTEEYPNKAPVGKFKSHMFHPNSKLLFTCMHEWDLCN